MGCYGRVRCGVLRCEESTGGRVLPGKRDGFPSGKHECVLYASSEMQANNHRLCGCFGGFCYADGTS